MIYNIPLSQPFLPSFIAHFLADIAQNPPQEHALDSLLLAKTTIYVPNKRTARSLYESFAQLPDLPNSLLPRIFSLSDNSCYEDFLLTSFNHDPLFEQPVGKFDRLFLLAQFIAKWHDKLPQHIKALFNYNEPLIPHNSAQSLYLAFDLARLLDEMERLNSDPCLLNDIVPLELEEWWQLSQSFLQIVFQFWPQILRERNLLGQEQWRSLLISRQIALWQQSPPDYPIIALGLKFPPAFIKAINELAQGRVYLDALDMELDEDSWQKLSDDNDATIESHPQYVFFQLLKALNISRKEVISLKSEAAPPLLQRAKLLSLAFLPAQATDKWQSLAPLERDYYAAALQNMSVIEAGNEYEEALAIAISMREALEEPERKVALITGDRNLARGVSAALQRFSIIANESLGRPLRESFEIVFIRLLLDNIVKPYDGKNLLAFLKHPLCSLGAERWQTRLVAEFLEYQILRRKRNLPLFRKDISMVNFSHFVREVIGDKLAFAEKWQQSYEQLLALSSKFEQALSPAQAWFREEKLSLKRLLQDSLEMAQYCAMDEEGSFARLYNGPAGETLIAFLEEVMQSQEDLVIDFREWPEVFNVLLQDINLTPKAFGHERVFIWGTLEARLQNIDRAIIAPLNEGDFPNFGQADPFLSRSMRRALALESPEYAMGLMAHDMQNLLCQKEVVMVRSISAKGRPASPSRWLQRLEAVVGPQNYQKLLERGNKYLALARNLDRGAHTSYSKHPNPRLPAQMQPKELSVSEVALLQRNPYAFYAKKILKLEPLPSLSEEHSAALRGQLYHAILDSFIKHIEAHSIAFADYEPLFYELMKQHFAKACLEPDIYALWWQSLANLVPSYLAFEKGRGAFKRYSEISSSKVLFPQSKVALSGRIDRLDIAGDELVIFDIKTSISGHRANACNLKDPQVPLLYGLYLNGGFAEFAKIEEKANKAAFNHALGFLFFTTTEFKPDIFAHTSPSSSYVTQAVKLAAKAWRDVDAALCDLQRPDDMQRGYVAAYVMGSAEHHRRYEHLARDAEWEQDDEQYKGLKPAANALRQAKA